MLKERFNAASLYLANVPYLLSLLYDINLLPEQCNAYTEKLCMIAIVEAYQEGAKSND